MTPPPSARPPAATSSAPAHRRHVTETELLHDAFRLGVAVANSGFRPTFIVGLWRGGSAVGIYVQECLQRLGIETDHIAIRTSYRGRPDYIATDPGEREVRVHGTQYLLETIGHEDGLLIVDDVFGSGATMRAVTTRLAARLKRNLPGTVRTAAVWYRPGPDLVGGARPAPDFHVRETADWLVMPYELAGLSREEIARHKPWAASILDSLDRLADRVP